MKMGEPITGAGKARLLLFFLFLLAFLVPYGSGLLVEQAIIKTWKDYGFTAEETRDWWAAGVYNRRVAIAFRANKIKSGEAAEWIQVEIEPDEAKEWKEGGFDIPAALEWRKYAFDPQRAGGWHVAGFSRGEATAWRTHAFTPEEAKSWQAAEYSPLQAAEARRAGRSPQ
jgi:hypothetical protein